MKVSIKKFEVEMEVKNKGIEFEVRDNSGEFLGDFYLSKKGVVWCRGRIPRKNGEAVDWPDLINLIEKA